MAKHPPASKSSSMRGTGLPVLNASTNPAPESPEQAEKKAYERSKQEFEDKMAELRAQDKIGEMMDHSTYVTDQSPTGVWGVKAAAERICTFSRWYFMVKDNAIIDTFMTQALYDAADVEARRAMAHRYGTRYAALGPSHSRLPHKDAKLRKLFPSMMEQLAGKIAVEGK